MPGDTGASLPRSSGSGATQTSAGSTADAAAGQASGSGPHASCTADVDDPRFWPSSSGIGREAAANSSSWVAEVEERHRARTAAAGPQSAGSGISVIVCESRPLCEGVVMACQLAAAGLDVTVITDAQAAVFIDDVDLVLLGADAVTPGGVVNKVGSKLLALAAKAAGVPVVAVTDSLKVSPGPVSSLALPHTPAPAGEEEKAVDELLEAWGQDLVKQVQGMMRQEVSGPHGEAADSSAAAQKAEGKTGSISSSGSPDSHGCVSIRNVYFESVPLVYLSGLLTDKGMLTGVQVAELIKQQTKDYQQAFGLTVNGDMLAA